VFCVKKSCQTIRHWHLCSQLGHRLFSRAFVVGSVLDTRERSVTPEYVHSFKIRACSGWIWHLRKKTMSCVPLSSFLAAFFTSKIWAKSGWISSTLASDGRASHDFSLVRPLATSKGASQYWSDLEEFRSLM
jgi:hypothetical protein